MACTNYPLFCNSNFVFRDDQGNSYTFGHVYENLPLARDCSYTPPGIGGQDIHTNPIGNSDQSASVRLDSSNPNDIIVYTKDGTAYHFPAITTWPPGSSSSGPEQLQYYYDYDFVKIVDPNGNTITKSGNTITDSTGRTITAANQPVGGSGVTWTDSNGNLQTFTAAVNNSLPAGPAVTTQATNCQFNNPYQSTHQNQGYVWNGTDITNIGNYATGMTLSFPGGAVYTLQVDQLGKIAKISYPSGGYTSYAYQTTSPVFHLAYLTCNLTDYWEVAAKNVCSNVSGSCTTGQLATTTYTPGGAVDGSNFDSDVVDALGNRTHYIFAEVDQQGGVYSDPRESERDIYQGQSTLVRTVQTLWYGTADSALPKQVTTIYNDVTPNLSSYVYYTYDGTTGCGDNPQEIDEYDFTGTMVRKTNYT